MGFKAAATQSIIEQSIEVTTKIDRYIALRESVNEHKRLGTEIKEWLESNKVSEVKSPSGNLARLNPGKPGKKFFTWAVDKLQKYLKPKDFKLACPPTPLAAMLETAAQDDAKLWDCGEWHNAKPGNPSLEIIEAA